MDALHRAWLEGLSLEERRAFGAKTLQYEAGEITIDDLEDFARKLPGGQEWLYRVEQNAIIGAYLKEVGSYDN